MDLEDRLCTISQDLTKSKQRIKARKALEDLLTDNLKDVVGVLNTSQVFTWKELVLSVMEYNIKEIDEYLKKQVVTFSNIKPLLSTILKLQFENDNYSAIKYTIQHITDQLIRNSDFILSFIGLEYVQILGSLIIDNHTIRCLLTQDKWNIIYKCMCSLVANEDNANSRSLLNEASTVLLKLIDIGYQHSTLPIYYILNSLYKALCEFQTIHSSPFIKLISAFNILAERDGINCRALVCRIGDEILDSMLNYIINAKLHNNNITEQCLVFIFLQIKFHHPSDVIEPVYVTKEWINSLLHFHQVLLEKFQAQKDVFQLISTVEVESSEFQNIPNLFYRMLVQVERSFHLIIEYFPNSLSLLIASQPKKIKLTSVDFIDLITDNIPNHSHPKFILYLHLLSNLLANLPHLFKDRILNISKLLFDIPCTAVAELNHSIINEVIHCLISIVANKDIFLEQNVVNSIVTNILLQNAHLQKQPSYYELLSIILESNKQAKLPVICWKELQCSLIDSNCIEFLWKYLSIHDLPCCQDNPNSTLSMEHYLPSHSTRIFLINSLLPEKFDNMKYLANWLTSCDTFFMLGQILASQSMRSCSKSILLTERFFTDSMLRTFQHVTKVDSFSKDSIRIMLEFEFIPIPTVPDPETFRLYKSERSAIPSCNIEYIAYTNNTFSRLFNYFSGNEYKKRSTYLLSLFKYYFYFHFNLVIWSSFQTNSPPITIQNEFIVLVFNQFVEDLLQFPSIDTFSAILKLEEFFIELKMILSNSNYFYTPAIHSVFSSFLNIISDNIVNSLKSIISKLYESPSKQLPLPHTLNPLNTDLLDRPHTVTISIVRILCNLHWIYNNVSSTDPHHLDSLLTNSFLCQPLINLVDIKCVFSLQASIVVCEHFSFSGCSENRLCLILERLLLICTQLCKFNQTALNKVMLILQSLAKQLVCFIKVNRTISHHVENLLRILTSIYMNIRFSSANRIRYIEFIFHFHKVFHELNWPILTLQTTKFQENAEKTLEELIYELNLDFNRESISSQSSLLAGLHVTSSVIESQSHFCSFYSMINCLWDYDQSTYLTNNLIPGEYSDSTKSDHVKYILLFIVKMAISCSRKCSFLVAQILNFFKTKSIDSLLINKVLSNIAIGLSYPDLQVYFESNLESIMIEWRVLSNSICDFPFELIGLNELDFVEQYATKCLHLILLTSDSEAMGFMVKSLSQVKSNPHLLKFCFEHYICTILLNSTDQLSIIGLSNASSVYPQANMTEARNYILQQLSLELRKQLTQNNVKSCLSSLFTKYIGSCSEQRKQFIESISPPLFVIDINISCLEENFVKMFGISLFSLFKEDPYLLPKLHISILKKLYASVQPHTVVFNLYAYCTFLQFVSINPYNCTDILYFLLCDPVHVLFEFLTEGDEIGTDIHRIKSKFRDSITHEDTFTLLQTLIIIYRTSLRCIPKLVENTISILFDILCYHGMSIVQEISSLCLNCIKELFADVLFKTYHPKLIAILIFIPSNPVFEEINNWLNKKFQSIIRYEILQELAVNTWYTRMSCVTYLNQVKSYLQLSLEQANDSYDFNSLFDDLVQRIHVVSTASNSPEKLSELLCEIFLLLTPFYSRHRLAFECGNLDVYTRPITLNASLYHFPILLSRLSKLVKSTNIQLKEIAYTTYYSFPDPLSLLTTITAYKQSGEYSNLPMIYSSYLLKKISKLNFCNTENTNTHIPFQIPLENSVYQTKIWVRKLCIFLLENYIKNPIILNTKPLIELSDESAQDFLKMYIYEVILEGEGNNIFLISKHLNSGLKQSFDFIHNTNSSTIPIENCVNEFSIRIIMEIVQFLRRKVLFDKQCRSFRDNFLLDINYLYLACSAFYCKDYHSTLLYLHIYMDPLCSEYSSQHSVPYGNLVVPKLLINTYGELVEIECVNSVPCNSLYLEFQKVKLVGKWSEVIQMCCNSPFNQISNSKDLTEAMYEMGWYSMLLQQSKNNSNNEFISNLHYESAWRLSLWDEKLPDLRAVNSNEIFSQQIIYDGIQAFKERDISYVREHIFSNVTHTLREFLHCSEGSIFNFSHLLSNISIANTLIQFSIFAESVLASHRQSHDFPSHSLLLPSKEKLKDILSIRVSLVLRLVNFLEAEECCDRKYYISLFELILNDVIAAAKLARKSNHCSEANNLLHTLELKLESMEILPQKFKNELLTQISLESVKVKLLQKDFQTCHSVLKLNMNRFSKHPTQFPELYCYFLTLYGNFLGETQQETASNVISLYLERSVNTLQQLEYDISSPSQVKLLEKAYFSLAQFSDKQYSIIVDYLNSPEYKVKLELAEAFDRMSQLSLNTPDLPRRTLVATREQAKEYHQQSCEFEKDKIEYLKKALESYCFCLELSNTHDMTISRVISLWFDNSDNHEINQMLPSHLNAISSHKFIPWVFQIIPRLCFIPNDVTTPFSLILTDLVIKMTTDHPYHCLPILFAIFLSPLDHCFNSLYTYGSLDILTLKLELINNDKSVFRCRNILDKVRMLHRDIVLKMENIFTDLIMLAYHRTSIKPSGIKIPKECPLLRESNIQNLPILTIEIPISPLCNYADVVKMVKFEPTFMYPGGNSKPKLFTCLGSDGNRYKMLLKGREDLRKDAVIQQGFSLINQLLAQDSWFVEKGVTIRTYRIVPLSQGSGLISICEGTISLSDYLVNKDGAHQRYYPKTPTSLYCEEIMKSARKESNQKCLTSFRKVCQIFHPVFRFFFFEMFNDSTTWFQRKMQYTRSVAVTSMASYIFGIGDRHTENIRINTSTAEIVHIDFGELFDSGKHLPVPELVPFRLTRDIVDPMGQLGKDGVFRPCCEETLRIIRQSKENIKSIINVLLHTPLHEWKILQNCLKASIEKQSSQSQEIPTAAPTTTTVTAGNKAGISILGEDTNEIALRVLLRINEKIDGIEGRTPLSIAGQVNRLIAEATDEVNLSLMYSGWKAWV